MQNKHLCADIVFNLSVLGRIACAIRQGSFPMSGGAVFLFCGFSRRLTFKWGLKQLALVNKKE